MLGIGTCSNKKMDDVKIDYMTDSESMSFLKLILLLIVNLHLTE